MYKKDVIGAQAAAPWHGFDSRLEKPSGDDPRENARLTLQLRLRMNFVDSKNPLADLTTESDGKWWARDSRGYLFPMLDWTADGVDRFMRGMIKKTLDTWDLKFLLVTPQDFDGLDFSHKASPMKLIVRPHVLCLLRVALYGPNGGFDLSPAAGPLSAGAPHRTIHVFRLDTSVVSAELAPDVAPTKKKPQEKTFGKFTDGSFGSDSRHYDDSDLYRSRVIDKENNVMHNTIGHEIGHALGQSHIMWFRGDPTCELGLDTADKKPCYGVGDKFWNNWNIMGGGDKLFLLNAVSWRQRIALHTGVAAEQWSASRVIATPPRLLANPLFLLRMATAFR